MAATATIDKGKRVTGRQREDLAGVLKQRYELGVPIRDLAAEFGRSYGFVHRVLVESGVRMRGRGGATRGAAAAARKVAVRA
jgi:hypothetical protein